MTMESLPHCILQHLDKQGEISNSSLFKHMGNSVDSQVFLGAIKSLLVHGMIEYEAHEEQIWKLTDEGKEIVSKGSHEAQVFNAVLASLDGLKIAELQNVVGPAAKFGQGKAFQNKWIKKDGDTLKAIANEIVDQTRLDLEQIEKTGTLDNEKTLNDLKKRKLVDKEKIVWFSVKKGEKFALEIPSYATDLTSEMLTDGSWKTAVFKEYNLNAMGIPPKCGHLHPLMKVREEFRNIFFVLGFEEMPTNNYVESSFWNFDALFQPQQHPARDAHDTFFLKSPKTSNKFPLDYLERVKKQHAEGGNGSIGYRYDWKIEEAQKNLLRTHTTAVSARMLYKLAQQKEFKPVKYFSIDKVFRNESVDATHLAEFHQVEGLIADYDLTLGHLIGVLDAFFKMLGLTDLEFKPAYNPYTEPSMEIFAYHPGLKKRIEVGNSGIFRPEMILPMGFDKRVTVIAWGLSLERPAMIKYGYNNIRDLVGHKVPIESIERDPICRLDK